MMNISNSHSHKRKRDSHEISRVSNSKKRYIVYDDVAEGSTSSSSSSDIVWAKANNSNTYWPGSIIKRVNGKLLVSFFDCKTTNWIYDSEIRYFENNYMPIMLDIGGMKLRNAIDCALNEFVNRLTLEYSCACENDGNQGRGGLLKKVFEPVEALAFVCRMAVSPFFDGVDSVGVIKGVAQVNAFRRCVFIKRDWIYRDTMRIEESVGDSEADLGTYMEDERGCSVAQEVENCEEEEFSEGEEYSEEEEEEEKVVEVFSEEELEQEKVVEEHSEEEEEQEKVVEEFSEEEGEFSNKVDTEPVKSSAIISKEDTTRPIKELSSIERSQVSIEKVSQSLEALAFVHKMDYTEEVSQPLEALAFVHKMDYAEEEEFSEEEKEEEVSAEEPEEEELFDEEEEFSDKVDTELENVGSVICNEDSMKPPGEQYFIGGSHISTKKVFQPLEALTFVNRMAYSEVEKEDVSEEEPEEEEEGEEFPDKIDSELVKSCSVICNDGKKPLEGEHFIERSHISTKKVFQPLEALTFVHGMTYYEEKKLSEEEEKEEEEFSEEEEPEEEDTFEEEEADVFDKLETELVRSGSLVCKEDSMKLLEEQSYIERSQVSIKVFQPLETLACVRRLAVCPWADKVDTVAVVEAAAQVIAFRCYVYTKSDWAFQKRMRVYESTDESETNLKSIVLEDEQMCRAQEVRFSYDKEEKNHKPLVKQINRGAVNCKKSREDGLNEILRHLYCLALDPFYSGVKRFGVKYSDSMCQKILSYRELVYQKDLDLVPLNRSSYCNHVAETKKPHKVFGESSISCLSNRSVNVVVKGKIGVANDDGTERVQHNKKAKVEEKRQDVKVSCSRSNVEDVVEPVGRDVVDLLGNTPGHNDEYESIKRQKVSPVDTVIGFLEGSTKTQHRANTTLGYYGSQKSKLSSHVQENHVNINPCDEAGIDGRSVDLNVNCRSSCVLNTFPGETVFEDFIRTQCEGRLGVATIQSALLPNLTSKQSDLHFNVGTEVNSSKKELSLVIESGGSSEGNGRLSQLAVDISINSDQPNTFYPLNILNTSHSPVVSPASSRNAQFQSSKTDIKAECFTTLNMMFPKNFKLPSKDDLVKRFRSFGPLDSSETKVYSNMGSAQVVFLHHFDAEAAWHCAKTKKIFTGGADIRFWLGRQGHSRGGTNNIPTPSSFPTTGASISNMKSCIGVSNPQGMKDSTKPHRVKFLSDSKDVPSVPLEPKHGTCTGFGSCKYSKDVGPDISPQMLVLLEKCNDIVSEIKDNLGLQSFYTLLTHNFWETANLDDG